MGLGLQIPGAFGKSGDYTGTTAGLPGRWVVTGRFKADMRQHIVFLDRATLRARVRSPAFEHTWEDHPVTPPDELAPRLRNATIAITNKVPLRAASLQQLPQLKMIAVAATGYDVIDVDFCRSHGIAVANIHN